MKVMDVRKSVFLFIAILMLPAPTWAQSGATNNQTSRGGGREYAVNLTFAVYQYDPQRSPALEAVTRLNGTYSSAEDEMAYIKEKQKLDALAVRHVRSVGLRSGETFNDAVLLGPEYMTLVVTPHEVGRGTMKLDVKVRYASQPLLEASGVEVESFETVLLRGGKGMFGVKTYIGEGGRPQSAPIERAMLLSVTPETVPMTNLRNRPEQLSHPVDEFGRPIEMKESDRFTPPVAIERVAPKFDAGRAVRGSVLLAGTVTPQGQIINLRVVRSLDSMIDDRAMAALRQYKFSPGLLNGQPVYATFREEITFAAPPSEPEQAKPQDQKKKTIPFPRRRWPFPLM